jgi:hypothetical protein
MAMEPRPSSPYHSRNAEWAIGLHYLLFFVFCHKPDQGGVKCLFLVQFTMLALMAICCFGEHHYIKLDNCKLQIRCFQIL